MDMHSPLSNYVEHLHRHGVVFRVSETIRHDSDVTQSDLDDDRSPRQLTISPTISVTEFHGSGRGASHATMMLARSLVSDTSISTGTRVLDLGSGTGVLSQVVVQKGGRCIAAELDPHANALASKGMGSTNLSWRILTTDLLENEGEDIDEMQDLIVANLPQKPTPHREQLPLANAGGPDGARLYRAVLPLCNRLLKTGGVLAFMLHSLPDPSFLRTLQTTHALTLIAWRLRFLGSDEFPDLLPYWQKRHDAGSSLLLSINGRVAILMGVWLAQRLKGAA